jgi:hypothetical protein
LKAGPVVGISSMLDAAVYGGVENIAKVVESTEEKLEKLR